MDNEPQSTAPIPDAIVGDLIQAFERLRGACLRIAAATVRDFGLAEEVVQESFLAAWQHAPVRYDPSRGSLENWLLTLTRHKAVDAVRHAEHVRRVQHLEEAEPLREITIDLPEDLVIRADEARELRRYLSGLPAAQQRVLLLTYWFGLSQSQISSSDGTPLGTVKSRATTALQRLRESLPRDSP